MVKTNGFTLPKMKNLYYDLPNDILYKIDDIIHQSNTNKLMDELKIQIAHDNYHIRLKNKCFDKLRAYHEIFYYEDNLSQIKKQMSLAEPLEHPLILQNRLDCARSGLAWLYDHYDMTRTDCV